MNLQLPKVISKDLARQVIEQLVNDKHLSICQENGDLRPLSINHVLAILFPDD